MNGELKAMTFDEWKSQGFVVCRGQKSSGRNANGKPTFTEGQVKPLWIDEDADPDCPMEQWARGEWP